MIKKILIGVGVIAAIIAVLMATGALKLNFSIRPSGAENTETQQPQKQEFVLPEGWQKYTSGEFGYSVAYPGDWNVTENNNQGSRDLLIVAPESLAFVRIAAFQDSSLVSIPAIETSMAEYKASFENKPNEDLKEFQTQLQDTTGGFGASGFMSVNGVTYQFLERGILATNGRVLIMRGAVDTTETSTTQAEFDAFVATAKQVMDSFNVQ